jgi:SAM-dependent methyltransferase
VGWSDAGMQALRFEILSQVMEGAEPVSVADFGCGIGALFTHLATRAEPPPLGAYVGYDLAPGMIAAARDAIDDPVARFVVGSEVTEDADYVLASGALTIRPGVSEEEWEAHVQEVLRGLWVRARRGLGFNLLSREVERVDPDTYAGDPGEWAAWCMRELPDAAVALVRRPPLNDFSVLVRRT